MKEEEDVRQHYVSVHLYDLYYGLLKILELFSYLIICGGLSHRV